MAEPRERADVVFFARIGAIDRLATQRLERALPDGLSAAGLAVLSQLALGGDAPTPQGLATALQLSKPAMTHTLQRLEGAGQVAIAGDPVDRRRKRVAPTAAGAATLRTAAARVRPRLDEIRAAFAAAQFEAALPFLERLSAWLMTHP
jgi:DNA-binding MarR family transcriptional regulator